MTLTPHSVTDLIERYHADLDAIEQQASASRERVAARFKADITALMFLLQASEQGINVTATSPREALRKAFSGSQDFQR